MRAQKAMPLLQLLWKFFTSTLPLTLSPDRTCDGSKGLSSALAPLPSATFFCAQSSRPSLAVRSPSLISATE